MDVEDMAIDHIDDVDDQDIDDRDMDDRDMDDRDIDDDFPAVTTGADFVIEFAIDTTGRGRDVVHTDGLADLGIPELYADAGRPGTGPDLDLIDRGRIVAHVGLAVLDGRLGPGEPFPVAVGDGDLVAVCRLGEPAGPPAALAALRPDLRLAVPVHWSVAGGDELGAEPADTPEHQE